MKGDCCMIGLVVLIGAVVLLLSMLPNEEPYKCKACDFETYDREQAAGHVHLHGLHKIDL